MINLDDILGDGATKAFEEAVTISSEEPPVFVYSNWQYQPASQVQLDGLEVVVVTPEINFGLGEGVWRKASVFWGPVSQEIFFKDKIIHWGNGLCSQAASDAGILKNLATAKMKTFLATYIDEMKITLPNLESFYGRFLLAGFEILDENDNQVLVGATLKDPNSRIVELFNWRINGTIPEEEPAWRTAIRSEIGLESLFPNE